jgi:hypothetical protein
MKKLLYTCYIIWGIFFFGKDYFPIIFRNFYIFWSVNIGLIVLLSVGFAKSLFIYFKTEDKTIKSISHSALFILLFLLMNILPITVHHAMNTLKIFEISADRILPIRDTSAPDTQKSRKCLASYLFIQYGIKIPYKLDSGEFKIFKPSKEQIKEFEMKLNRQKETLLLERNISRLAWSSFVLSIIESVLFFIVFVATMIYEQKKESIKR